MATDDWAAYQDIREGAMSDTIKTRFSSRVLELRKALRWKHDELGGQLGTSGVIDVRYEHGKMIPSLEVAQRMTDVFGVALDYLVGEKGGRNLPSQGEMMECWASLTCAPNNGKERMLYFIDPLIQNAKTRKACGTP